MRLVIEQGGVKRELADEPFLICTDQAGLQLLADCVADALRRGHNYGWVEIRQRPQRAVNSAPIPWADASGEGGQ